MLLLFISSRWLKTQELPPGQLHKERNQISSQRKRQPLHFSQKPAPPQPAPGLLLAEPAQLPLSVVTASALPPAWKQRLQVSGGPAAAWRGTATSPPASRRTDGGGLQSRQPPAQPAFPSLGRAQAAAWQPTSGHTVKERTRPRPPGPLRLAGCASASGSPSAAVAMATDPLPRRPLPPSPSRKAAVPPTPYGACATLRALGDVAAFAHRRVSTARGRYRAAGTRGVSLRSGSKRYCGEQRGTVVFYRL